jgi:alkanesulfonate monooxygenase SsuD/methylene tetrahydromethanopterin reductase-like flavin-dependent oxidoreductase (luciferase family)
MKIGIYVGGHHPGHGDRSGVVTVASVRTTALAARDAGLDCLFVGQHVAAGPVHSYPEPLTLLSYFAALCPGMYLGTGILILPLHHPALLAEQLASLDALSGGRLILGVGQGYRDIEFAAVGLEKRQKAIRLRQSLEAMRSLWANDRVTLEGDGFQLHQAGAGMRPARPGGPPILIAADTEKTVVEVARLGGHWLVSPRHSRPFIDRMLATYKEALAQVGRPYFGVPMARELALGTPDVVARVLQEFDAPYYEAVYVKWKQPGEEYTVTFQEDFDSRVIFGGPEAVARQIIREHHDRGCDLMVFRVFWPDMPLELAVDTITMLGQEVLPVVRASVGDGCSLLGE